MTNSKLDADQFVAELNEDLRTEYQSIVQYVSHIATVTGAELMRVVDELKNHLTQELCHVEILAEQVAFLGGQPTTTMTPVIDTDGSIEALEADLSLETNQLVRYRERVRQASELGLMDVAEALRPLLEQTQ